MCVLINGVIIFFGDIWCKCILINVFILIWMLVVNVEIYKLIGINENKISNVIIIIIVIMIKFKLNMVLFFLINLFFL